MREEAVAVLDGQVNDWVAAARAQASAVLVLCGQADAASAESSREIAARDANTAALERLLADARKSARREKAKAKGLEVEVQQLRARVLALWTAATNLNERIVETSDNTFSLTYGSLGAVKALRKAIADA